VSLLCHQTGLPFTVVFMSARSGRVVWLDHVAAGSVTNENLDVQNALDLFPTLPWRGVRCPCCGAEVIP
jgi:hypothetical protein